MNAKQRNMSRVAKLLIPAMTSMFGLALSAQPAAANVQRLLVQDDRFGGGRRAVHGHVHRARHHVHPAERGLLRYNRDGSARTYTRRGGYARFTVPGGGVVLLDTGIATWSEPDEDLLFAGGPHQAVNGDFDAFCAAFG